MKQIKLWWLAIRPKTLSITLSPVLCAVALVFHYQATINWLTAAVILSSALLIQVATNLFNDVADFERGADNAQRIGPLRVTASGLLSATQVKNMAYGCFLFAFIFGIYLVYIGGWPIILIGLASISSGYAYTGGIKPIAYSPLGELFVIVFFGLIAVSSSVYLLSPEISRLDIYNSLWFGLALGCFAAAILLVNNYRDLEGDIKANKLTLVYYLGRDVAKIVYSLLVTIPYFIILYLWLVGEVNLLSLLLTFITLIFALKLIHTLYISPINQQLNKLLAKTAVLQLLYTVFLVLGIALNIN
ncbi:MAG: 1,4-dihydroxy-2-naphthoate octaprenyltransferase [Pseudomonadota bacterium]